MLLKESREGIRVFTGTVKFAFSSDSYQTFFFAKIYIYSSAYSRSGKGFRPS